MLNFKVKFYFRHLASITSFQVSILLLSSINETLISELSKVKLSPDLIAFESPLGVCSFNDEKVF
jgi:hypothetical protein